MAAFIVASAKATAEKQQQQFQEAIRVNCNSTTAQQRNSATAQQRSSATAQQRVCNMHVCNTHKPQDPRTRTEGPTPGGSICRKGPFRKWPSYRGHLFVWPASAKSDAVDVLSAAEPRRRRRTHIRRRIPVPNRYFDDHPDHPAYIQPWSSTESVIKTYQRSQSQFQSRSGSG